MYSPFGIRESRKSYHDFMDSESHNGIYQAADRGQHSRTGTTRDALDLRIGKADESTSYFGGINLLSDVQVQGSSAGLPSTQTMRMEYSNDAQNHGNSFRRENVLEEGTSASNPATISWLRDGAEVIENDPRTRRLRVVSEGDVLLPSTETSAASGERTKRQRSISMTYHLDSSRTSTNNFRESQGIESSSRCSSGKTQNITEIDRHLQIQRNIPREIPSESSLEYIQGKTLPDLDDRLVGRRCDVNYQDRIDGDYNNTVNESSQRVQSFSPKHIRPILLSDQHRISNVEEGDINVIPKTEFDPNLTEYDDNYGYRQNSSATKISIDVQNHPTRHQMGHRYFKKKHLRSMYNPNQTTGSLSPVPEDLPISQAAKLAQDLALSERIGETERDMEARHDEERWLRQRLIQSRAGREVDLSTIPASRSPLDNPSQSYSTPLSVEISEDNSIHRKLQLASLPSYPFISSGETQTAGRETIHSTSSVARPIHTNDIPALLQKGTQPDNKRIGQYTLHRRDLEYRNVTKNNVGQMINEDNMTNIRKLAYVGDTLEKDIDAERKYLHNTSYHLSLDASRINKSGNIVAQNGDVFRLEGQKIVLMENSNQSHRIPSQQHDQIDSQFIKQEPDESTSPVELNGYIASTGIPSYASGRDKHIRMFETMVALDKRQISPPRHDNEQLRYISPSPGRKRILLSTIPTTDTIMHINGRRYSDLPDSPEDIIPYHSNAVSSVAQALVHYPKRNNDIISSPKELDGSLVPSTNAVQHSPTMQQSKTHIYSPSFDHNTSASAKYNCFPTLPKVDRFHPLEYTQSRQGENNSSIPSTSPPPLPLVMKNKSYFLNRVLQQKFTNSQEIHESRFPKQQSSTMSDSSNPNNSAIAESTETRQYFDIHSQSSSSLSGSTLQMRSPNSCDEQETTAAADEIDERLTNATILSNRSRKRHFPMIDDDSNVRGCETFVRTNSDIAPNNYDSENPGGNVPQRPSEPRAISRTLLSPPSGLTEQESRNISASVRIKHYSHPDITKVAISTSSSSFEHIRDSTDESLTPYQVKRYRNTSNGRDDVVRLMENKAEEQSIGLQSTSLSTAYSTSLTENKCSIPSPVEPSESFKRSILFHCQQKSRIAAVAMAAAATSSLSAIDTNTNPRISPRPGASVIRQTSPLPSPPSKIHQNVLSRMSQEEEGINLSEIQERGGPGSVGSGHSDSGLGDINNVSKGKRGRPRKHAPKIPLPPLYVFIRNMLHNRSYNPKTISWVNENIGVFKVNNTCEFARTWGSMKSNRSEEMNYEKMSRAMRYHYGSEKQGRKGHLAMVKEKRLVYRFGELAINWRSADVCIRDCQLHDLCKDSLCLWTKE